MSDKIDKGIPQMMALGSMLGGMGGSRGGEPPTTPYKPQPTVMTGPNGGQYVEVNGKKHYVDPSQMQQQSEPGFFGQLFGGGGGAQHQSPSLGQTPGGDQVYGPSPSQVQEGQKQDGSKRSATGILDYFTGQDDKSVYDKQSAPVHAAITEQTGHWGSQDHHTAAGILDQHARNDPSNGQAYSMYADSHRALGKEKQRMGKSTSAPKDVKPSTDYKEGEAEDLFMGLFGSNDGTKPGVNVQDAGGNWHSGLGEARDASAKMGVKSNREAIDLLKAKYIERTGGPGNYKYKYAKDHEGGGGTPAGISFEGGHVPVSREQIRSFGEADVKASDAIKQHGFASEGADPAVSASQGALKDHVNSYSSGWTAEQHKQAARAIQDHKHSEGTDYTQNEKYALQGLANNHSRMADDLNDRKVSHYKGKDIHGPSKEIVAQSKKLLADGGEKYGENHGKLMELINAQVAGTGGDSDFHHNAAHQLDWAGNHQQSPEARQAMAVLARTHREAATAAEKKEKRKARKSLDGTADAIDILQKHKYVRREGSPGSYRYFYEDETGSTGPAAQKFSQSGKVSTSGFPQPLQAAMKKEGFKGRQAYVKPKESIEIHPSTHAPEYDNFDYSFHRVVDLRTGRTTDPQQGMKRGDAPRTIKLDKDTAVISGDRNSSYMQVHMHPDAFGEGRTFSKEDPDAGSYDSIGYRKSSTGQAIDLLKASGENGEARSVIFAPHVNVIIAPGEVESEGIDAKDVAKGGEGSRGGKVTGHTKSGRAIYQTCEHCESNFKTAPGEAIPSHSTRNKASNWEPTPCPGAGSTNKSLSKGGGEGSRGGKVIGHTQSGKPIYADSHPRDYEGFSRNDHEDAARAHGQESEKFEEKFHDAIPKNKHGFSDPNDRTPNPKADAAWADHQHHASQVSRHNLYASRAPANQGDLFGAKKGTTMDAIDILKGMGDSFNSGMGTGQSMGSGLGTPGGGAAAAVGPAKQVVGAGLNKLSGTSKAATCKGCSDGDCKEHGFVDGDEVEKALKARALAIPFHLRQAHYDPEAVRRSATQQTSRMYTSLAEPVRDTLREVSESERLRSQDAMVETKKCATHGTTFKSTRECPICMTSKSMTRTDPRHNLGVR